MRQGAAAVPGWRCGRALAGPWCDAVLRPGAAVRCDGLAGCGGMAVRRALLGCGRARRRAVRCGGATGPPGAVRRAAREGDPPAWGFWLLANGRKGHVPTPATNRLVAKPEKKYCGVCPMP